MYIRIGVHFLVRCRRIVVYIMHIVVYSCLVRNIVVYYIRMVTLLRAERMYIRIGDFPSEK